MKSIIHIACAADNNYVQHTGVMLTSLFENNKNNIIHLHFFSAEFEDSNVLKLKNITEKYNQSFTFYKLNESDFKDCYISNHLTFATYYKIIIPSILEKITDKVLYLDTDIVVFKDIGELWDTKIDNNVLGAINDTNFEACYRLGFPFEYNYFNAGVLLLNCRIWVIENLSQKLFEYIKLYSNKLDYHEQDALNANIKGNWLRLPPKYNQMSILFEVDRNILLKIYTQDEIKEADKFPIIIHFSGSSKPWDYLNIRPYKEKYFQYLNLTEWKDFKPTSNFKSKLKFVLLKTFGKKIYTSLFDILR